MNTSKKASEEFFHKRDLKFPVETFDAVIENSGLLFMHWHPDLEISYKIEGSATYIINGYHELVEAGDLIIINPKQVHQAIVTSEAPLKSEVIIMNYNFIKSQMMDIVNEDVIIPLIKTKYLFHNVIKDKEVISLFHEIRNELLQKTVRYQLRVKKLMFALIDMLFEKGLYHENKAYKRKNEIDSNDTTRHVIELIHSKYNTQITLDKIANSVQVSKFHLCKLFKSTTGTTINTYLNNYRISQSTQLLKDTKKNVTEIAYDVGFNNPSYFIKKFKEIKGITPNQYKNTSKI
jgi:AraC-like DNA-binding protein